MRGDEGAHVEKTVRLAGGVVVDDREVRTDRLGGIERHREREEQAARGGGERRLRRRQVLGDQLLERAIAVVKRRGHRDAHLAGAIPRIELRHALEIRRHARNGSIKRVHAPPPALFVMEPSVVQSDGGRQRAGKRVLPLAAAITSWIAWITAPGWNR